MDFFFYKCSSTVCPKSALGGDKIFFWEGHSQQKNWDKSRNTGMGCLSKGQNQFVAEFTGTSFQNSSLPTEKQDWQKHAMETPSKSMVV